MKGEQQLARWRSVFTAGGGLMPWVFLTAGQYLFAFNNPWWIVGAQLAWLTLWTFVGIPWLFCTLDEHQLELRANALAALCEATDPPPTQAQLNAACARMGLGQWHTHNPHDDDPQT